MVLGLSPVAVTCSIFSAFDADPLLEMCVVFLNLSKAFDKVLHDGLLCKLQNNEIDGNVLCLIKSCLPDRHKNVVLNGKSTMWKPVTVRIPQSSVLCPFFFLVYINDLLQIILRHGCSPIALLHILRTPFPTNTSEWLLMCLIL